MRPAWIGHRFEQVGKAMQDLGLLTTSGREDTLACDTISTLLIEGKWQITHFRYFGEYQSQRDIHEVLKRCHQLVGNV